MSYQSAQYPTQPFVVVLTPGYRPDNLVRLDHPIMSIGRDANRNVVVNNDACISTDCQLRQIGSDWFVMSNSRSVSTSLNGERTVSRSGPLQDGDVIGIGQTEIFFYGWEKEPALK